MFLKKLRSILFFSVVLSGCSKDQPNVELVQNMMDSPAIKAQDYDPSAPDGRAELLPPEGTIKKGFTPYTFTDPVVAGNTLVNPIAGKMESLERGQKMYYTYCAVCHGATGGGDGPVAEKFLAKPPALTTKNARDFKDGYIYHMIVAGRGLMGSYAGQIPKVEDRWALVNFVRQIQKNTPVKE